MIDVIRTLKEKWKITDLFSDYDSLNQEEQEEMVRLYIKQERIEARFYDF